jgi:hypothetical protein
MFNPDMYSLLMKEPVGSTWYVALSWTKGGGSRGLRSNVC